MSRVRGVCDDVTCMMMMLCSYYRHIGVRFNKTMSLLGFDTLFKPIIIAYLLVYVNIVILKPRFSLRSICITKNIRLLHC